MIILTNTQKQDILKYVEDKTYPKRLCFIISVIMFVMCLISLVNVSTDSETFYELISGFIVDILCIVITLKDVIKFRNVKNQLEIDGFIATKKQIFNTSINKTVQETDYSDTFENSTLYKGSTPPRNFRVTIHKYYIFDKYSNKYECIKYLDYKRCIEKGEFISVDFPTGEKFALHE